MEIMEDKDRQLLTIDEAAGKLKLSPAKTWQLTRTGELHSIKIGWSRRVPVEAIGEYIDRLTAEQASAS